MNVITYKDNVPERQHSALTLGMIRATKKVKSDTFLEELL